MDLYCIARKNKGFLDSPVFHAGEDEQQEAVAVFTELDKVEKYISEANWKEEYEPGKLKPIQLLRWLTIANEEGPDMVTINPEWNSQLQNVPQHVIDLKEPLDAFAETLREKLVSLANEPV